MADGSGFLNIAGRIHGGDRWRGKHVALDHANPFCREFFKLLNFQKVSITEVAQRSGVNHATIQGWKRRTAPTIQNLEAALNVLGFGLRIAPLDEPIELSSDDVRTCRHG